MTHSIPLRAIVLTAIIKLTPFKAETELPGKRHVSKEPPSVLPQPGLVYSTGNILKNAEKKPTTTYIMERHNNLCEASQNCGLGYTLLHFHPRKAGHNPEVVKMLVNKMVLTRRYPSGGSLLHHGQQQTSEYRISAISQRSAIQWFYEEK